MTRPRSALVSLVDTPWYHCVVHCVRSAYLCGYAAASGKNFDHQRGWIVQRIKEFSVIFPIDVGAYADHEQSLPRGRRVDAERKKIGELLISRHGLDGVGCMW